MHLPQQTVKKQKKPHLLKQKRKKKQHLPKVRRRKRLLKAKRKKAKKAQLLRAKKLQKLHHRRNDLEFVRIERPGRFRPGLFVSCSVDLSEGQEISPRVGPLDLHLNLVAALHTRFDLHLCPKAKLVDQNHRTRTGIIANIKHLGS